MATHIKLIKILREAERSGERTEVRMIVSYPICDRSLRTERIPQRTPDTMLVWGIKVDCPDCLLKAVKEGLV